MDELERITYATDGGRDDSDDDAIDFEQNDTEEQNHIHKFSNVAAICTQAIMAMKSATWMEEPCHMITYTSSPML